MQYNLSAASAIYQASNLPVKDFGTLLNAFINAPSVPAMVSFTVEWNMFNVPQTHIRNQAQGYEGTFWVSQSTGAATLEYSAAEAGFNFVSDPAATSSSYFAQLGSERNGIFFGFR